jgi:hypothetical protein
MKLIEEYLVLLTHHTVLVVGLNIRGVDAKT